MCFIATIAPADARGPVAEMYRRQEAAWGFVPNYARAFSHRPALMAAWAALLAEIKRPMDKRRLELATFAAAHELRHSACALAHGRVLREFFSDEAILAIAEQRPHPTLSDAELALLRFARRVARDAAQVDALDIAALRGHGYADAEIFDIAAAAAARAFFTKLLDAMGVLADAPPPEMTPALCAALTVGRPVDTAPRVTMPPAPAPGAHADASC